MLRIASSMVLLLVVSTSAHAADPKKKLTYDEHILPIMRDKCLSCHNGDKKSGGLVLDNYTKMMLGGSSGESIRPGDPDASKLYLVMAHQEQPYMPPKSPKLPNETVELVKQWIIGGALENAGSKVVIANKPKMEIGLTSVVRGKPEGPPPMPQKPLPLDPIIRTGKVNAITAIGSSPWAPLVAVGGQKQVLLYNSDTLDPVGVLPFPEGTPHVLKFSRNGSLLLAGGGRGGKSGRVVVWNVRTGERIFDLGSEHDAVLAADISADQTQIALGGPSKIVRIYSTKDGQLLHELKKHTDWIYSLEYSPDGVLLASGDRNGGVFVWESFTGREYFSLRGHTAAIMDISWRHDSNVLATASEDTTIKLWEMENGGQIKNWGAHPGGVQSMKFGRDGRIVSCGRDRVAKVWDGNGAQQRAFDAFPDLALRTTFSHDTNRVIAGDWSGLIRVWNTADGKVVGDLSANPPTVAERLEIASRDLGVKQAAHMQAASQANASQQVAVKAAADLANAQKVMTEATAAFKTANDQLAAAKQNLDKANAAIAPLVLQITAKDVLTKALSEAAAKVKAAADQAKDNKDLAVAAAKAQDFANQAAAELAALQKAYADLTIAAKAVADQFAKSQQAVTAAASTQATAPKTVEALTAAAKAATDKAAADKAAADQAKAALDAAHAAVDKWYAALNVTRQAAK